jgi:hypothetical protein
MRIETGASSDRRNRVVIGLILCVAFAAWFAYDGFKGYPAKNIEWARQYMPAEGKEADFWINPRATAENLEAVRDQIATAARTAEPLRVEELTEQLGEPTFRDVRFAYYVGPAAIASFEIVDDRVVRTDRLEIQQQPSESDIRNQKVLALVLGVLAVVILVHFMRIRGTIAVVDEDGLMFHGERISWDAMESLDSSRLKAKGEVVLSYRTNGQERAVRLDSYAIEHFKEVVTAICQKKGFELKGAEPKQAD